MKKKEKKKLLIKNIKRQAQQAAALASGGYSAGSYTRPAFKNWRPGNGDANSDILYDLPELRSRSRDLARNAPIATSAINTVVTNVIGTGLTMQANPDGQALGLNDEQTAALKRQIESEWEMWCCSLEADASMCNDFYGLQSLAMRSMLESGDVIALTPSIRRNGNPYTLAIQLIEADRLINRDYARDTAQRMAGITLDRNGAAVSYDISDKHPGSVARNALTWSTVNTFGRNGRRNVLHLFDKRRPGQVRGVPYLAPVIESIKQISRYSDAELQAAVVSAALAIFVKMDSEAFETLFDGRSQETYINSASSWDGSVSMDMDGPGKAVNLLPGESVEVPNIGRPNANFDPFFLSMLKQIGPALEIPFEVLIKSFSSSYSASRAALLDFWRFVRVRRDFMATYFCEPIKKLWFVEAVSNGRIAAPGFFSDPIIRAAYNRSKWIGDSPGSIDPEKEVKAARERIDLGISTREKESVSYDGGDWEANHKQLAKENQARSDDGLNQESNFFNEQSMPPQS